MQDLDFILSDKPQVRRISFYLLDTGIFKNTFLKKYRYLLENKEYEIRETSPETYTSLLQSPSLFGDYSVICNLDETDGKVMEEIFKRITSGERNKYLFLLSKEALKTFEKNPVFSKTYKESQIFTEAEKNKPNFKPLFQLCFRRDIPYPESDITNFQIFKTAIEQLYFSYVKSIPEFINKFNYVANTCFVKETDERISKDKFSFNITVFNSILPTIREPVYFQAHDLIYKFLSHPENDTITELYLFVSKTTPDSSQIRLTLDTLYRTVFELLQTNAAFEKGTQPEFSKYKTEYLKRFSNLPLVSLFQFLVRFSELEPRFNKRDFLISFHNFLYVVADILRGK